MEKEFKIVIPTKGRAKTITSHLYVSNCIICCPESEKEDYAKKCPNTEIVTHPDTLLGIGLKRQWIYEKFGDVFMMDDDLKGIMKMTAKKGESGSTTPEQAYWIIQGAGNMARLAGCFLFGFNNFVRPEHYHGHKPFALTGYINGCGIGMLREGQEHLKFNPAIKTNNDFYICGINAFHYRKSWIDKRYCFSQDSFGDNTGGCAEIRTNEVEKKDYELLRTFFGAAIKLKSGGLFASKHAYSKSLEIPF